MKRALFRKALAIALAAAFPLAAVSLPAGEALAQTVQVQPKEGWYKNIVDTDFVKEHAQIPPRKDVTIIDARPAARQYDPGHIPGAINIPDSKFEQMTQLLPEDKARLVIVYCGGLECMLSHNVAHKMEKLGYGNIKVYAEGSPEWAKRGLPMSVSTAYVKKLLDEKEMFALIDARPKRVFDKGYITGAIHISDTDFDKHVDKLPADKATPLIYYCGGLECVLSDKSADKARKLGYSNVKTYAEGFPAWSKAFPDRVASAEGTAAATPAAAPAAAPAVKAADIVPGKEKGSISIASFEKIHNEAPGALLMVDVRDAKEFAAATIKGAINIPINQLEKRIEELPKDKPVVFFCGTGARAGEGYDTAKLLRPEVHSYFLDAEMTFNPDGTYKVTKAR